MLGREIAGGFDSPPEKSGVANMAPGNAANSCTPQSTRQFDATGCWLPPRFMCQSQSLLWAELYHTLVLAMMAHQGQGDDQYPQSRLKTGI